ncbi:SIR2 family protein [Leptospira neocaledonica]|uniref:Novel STAND NTPase 5 domain-containing protein n=1 Tax=Leptospira neocaledonica TaxID=2023192 RepID=A0A2N0A3A5_9LEPT|nr:SIR2 family protein [Leptospira neocaledonica]PJZ78789.1 hypothetical protein CH365_00725 [Leptospira neocaledonica]
MSVQFSQAVVGEMNLNIEIEKIKRKIASGIILFTGAGFSKEAKDYNGKPIPLGAELANELWDIYFPGQPKDQSTLKDIFHHARKKDPKRLVAFLQSRFRINTNELPKEYQEYINFPWGKVYTLNIDNIWESIYEKFDGPFHINPISCTSDRNHSRGYNRNLDIVHLNGTLSDLPNNVTFTDEDYGLVLTKENPYYSEFSSEFMRQMVIFIGSELEESVLWKYVNYRHPRKKIHGEKEFRPESYFISPSLSLARRNLLEDYNVTWIKMTATEFAREVLTKLRIEATIVVSDRLARISRRSDNATIPIVSDKIKVSKAGYSKSSFFLGQQPEWDDIVHQNLIKRELEIEVEAHLQRVLESPTLYWSEIPAVVVYGTAGDGKSTSLMNLMYKYNNLGSKIGWISSEDDIPLHSLKKYIRNTANLDILVLDDADSYGIEVFDLIKEAYFEKLVKLVIVIVRSGRWLAIESEAKTKNIEIVSVVSKKLNFREINDLLKILSETSMLGKLKSLSSEERIRVFHDRSSADSQLIAALIEATSGRKFDETIASEFSELDELKKSIYALLSIPTSLRLGLDDIEISISLGCTGNELLNALDKLEKARLIVKRKNGFQLRHKIVGQKVFEELISLGIVLEYFNKLSFGTAILINNGKHDQKKLKNIRKFCINHKRVIEFSGNNYYKSKEFYEGLETALKDDYQYWLQRGSFELEKGALDIAEICLINSLSLNQKDDIVHIQYADLKMKKANSSQHEEDARALHNEAKSTLLAMIQKRGFKDPYPYHILAHQGQIWLLRSFVKDIEKDALKGEFKYVLDEGVKKHPLDDQLKQLRIDFYKLYFDTLKIS